MRTTILLLLLTLHLSNSFGQLKCNAPMDDAKFRKAVIALSLIGQGAAFNQAMRSFTSGSCLSTNQIGRLAALYRDPVMRLDYACFAQSFALDRNNYINLQTQFPTVDLKNQFLSCIGENPTPPGPIGGGGCPYPMDQFKFMEIKNVLNSERNSILRMDMAKQMIPRYCFTTSQVRELTNIWSSEIDRRDFLYMAYDSTNDINNYFTLQDIFRNSIYKRDFVNWCMSK
jgi:hypothetical protein